MAKEADPTTIPEIEKVNDSVNNTKSPEANKIFFTKSIEIVFNTLDKQILKPLIKLAQQITGFKTSNKGAYSENAEDSEQAKLIQEIANKKLDLSKVKDPKERKRIEILQKRLGDEGLKLNAETKGALVEIIREAETKGEFNQAALPDCCRVVVNDRAETKAAIEKTTMRLLDKVGRDDSSESLIGRESSPADTKTSSSQNTPAKTPSKLESLLNTVKEDVKARVAAGSLTSAQGKLFDKLMANPKIQKNIDGYYDRSGPEKLANFFGTLIDRELPYYEGGRGTGAADLSQYLEWIEQVTDQGIEVTTVSSLSMNSDPLLTIELDNGPEVRKKAEKQRNIANQLEEELNPKIEAEADAIYMRLRTESPKFTQAIREGNQIDLYGEIIEAVQEKKTSELIEKYSPKSSTIQDSPNIQAQNTLQIDTNKQSENNTVQAVAEKSTPADQGTVTENAGIGTPEQCLETKIEVTTTVNQAPSNNISAEQEKSSEITVSTQEISPPINHQEDKLLAASSELHL
ncbi:MAG: hypothetical protein EBR67_02025 [Proteobacteria bacterium]|nr:hypothetical protein [Pseudomonadota bacterium]